MLGHLERVVRDAAGGDELRKRLDLSGDHTLRRRRGLNREHHAAEARPEPLRLSLPGDEAEVLQPHGKPGRFGRFVHGPRRPREPFSCEQRAHLRDALLEARFRQTTDGDQSVRRTGCETNPVAVPLRTLNG